MWKIASVRLYALAESKLNKPNPVKRTTYRNDTTYLTTPRHAKKNLIEKRDPA